MKIDVLVIGAGAAGMAAAIAAAKNRLKVIVAERDEITGGILNQCIHNGFGLHYFREELTGPEYAERFRERLSEYSDAIQVLTDCHVLKLSREQKGFARLTEGRVRTRNEGRDIRSRSTRKAFWFADDTR